MAVSDQRQTRHGVQTASLTGGSIGRRRGLRLLTVLSVMVVIAIVARWPVTTSVGFNYEVTVKRLTLFEKAIGFINRDLEMRRLTREVAGVGGTSEQRLLRMYEWVVDNIHPLSPGLPVVDDHVRDIFVRRYGAKDQRAEALAALASYDGMRGTILALGKDPRRRHIQLTVVQLVGRVVAFDVNNRIAFRKRSGELASLEDLVADPTIIQRASSCIFFDGAPYHEHLHQLGEATFSFERMENQRPWPRLRNELIERLFGH